MAFKQKYRPLSNLILKPYNSVSDPDPDPDWIRIQEDKIDPQK
jgi:hypothetical protein